MAENQGISDIHRRLQNVYGDLAVDKSTVSRWAKRVSSSDDEAIDAVRRWLRHQPVEWYRAGIQALSSRWRKAVALNGDYVEK